MVIDMVSTTDCDLCWNHILLFFYHPCLRIEQRSHALFAFHVLIYDKRCRCIRHLWNMSLTLFVFFFCGEWHFLFNRVSHNGPQSQICVIVIYHKCVFLVLICDDSQQRSGLEPVSYHGTECVCDVISKRHTVFVCYINWLPFCYIVW